MLQSLQTGHNAVIISPFVSRKLEQPVSVNIHQPCSERNVCIKTRLTSLEARRSGRVVPRAGLQQEQPEPTADHSSTTALKSITSKLSKKSSYRLAKSVADKLEIQHQLSDAKMTKWRYIEGEKQEEHRELSVDVVLESQKQQRQLVADEVLKSAGKTSGESNI